MHEPLTAHPPAALRPSACPGLLRIVAALDGGICRVKLAGGVLRAEQAEAVAAAAERYASGVIEATNRANLQIRGVGPDAEALIAGLLAAGLGPRNAGADDVRNVLLSPSAGIDPQQLFDTRTLAAEVLASLEQNSQLHGLSAKFALQLDGGEGLAMLEHHHDLWLSPQRVSGQVRLAFGLAGCPAGARALGSVTLAQGHNLVLAVLERFLALAGPEDSRMRHLLARLPGGAEAFVAGLGLPIEPIELHRQPALTPVLGIHNQSAPNLTFVAALAPLGRLTPAMLRGVAALARQFGDSTVRMTPWQGVLLANIAQADALAVQDGLRALGLLVSTDEPLARLVACTGAAGCAKGLADTKADAQALALLLGPGAMAQSVHLTGCKRSCACAHVAPATLLATAPGRYDLYVRDPAQPGFGRLCARYLSLDAAAAWLGDCSRSDTHD